MSPLDRRQFLKTVGMVATAGVTGTAAACSTAPISTEMERPSGRTIRIGLISPALGPYAKVGAEISNGFKLFLKDHDNLLGRHVVDLVLAEEGSTAASAKAAAQKLLGDGAVALTGVASPASLLAMRDVVEKAKVPLISANASPATLTSSFYIWRASYVEGEAGEALAHFARAEGSKAYVLADDTTSTRADAEQFVKAYEDAGGTVVEQMIGKGAYADKLAVIGSSAANVLFCAYLGGEAQALLEAVRRANLRIKALGPATLTETVDLAKLGQLPAQVYTASPYAPDLDNEQNRRFVASYHKAYQAQPTSAAMVAYDIASVIDKALRLIDGPPTAAGLNQALSLLGQIDSPRGLWTFNVNRTPQQKWYLRKLRLDGQVPANLLESDLAIMG